MPAEEAPAWIPARLAPAQVAVPWPLVWIVALAPLGGANERGWPARGEPFVDSVALMVVVPLNSPTAGATLSDVGLSTPLPWTWTVKPPFGPLSMIVNVPFRTPAAVGVNVTSVRQ